MTREEIEKKAARLLDTSGWSHSWHWDRDETLPWRPLTLKGWEQMLEQVETATELARRRMQACAELTVPLIEAIANIKAIEAEDAEIAKER